MRAGAVAANVARGIAFVPQERNTFRSMTVAENLDIPVSPAGGEGRRPNADGRGDVPDPEGAAPGAASTLSGGQQQMLALGSRCCAGPD